MAAIQCNAAQCIAEPKLSSPPSLPPSLPGVVSGLELGDGRVGFLWCCVCGSSKAGDMNKAQARPPLVGDENKGGIVCRQCPPG